MASLLVSGCDGGPPNRQIEVDALTSRLAAMPGALAASNDFSYSKAQGLIEFRIFVDVSDSITADELGAIVSNYLAELAGGKYQGYRVELDARHGWNVFAVDSGVLPIDNANQIVDQARSWAGLRRKFPNGTIALRATVTHPAGQVTPQEEDRSNLARLQLSEDSDYSTVADASSLLAIKFQQLAVLDWTITAGKDHRARIMSSRRFPAAAELDVWRKLNADQTIPHIDALRINGPVTPPVWFSEQTIQSHDVAVALALAERHLPIVAVLPAPVLYSASDQLSGHIGAHGNARGPVSVTIGGCTPRDPMVYLPIPGERALIDRYASCPR